MKVIERLKSKTAAFFVLLLILSNNVFSQESEKKTDLEDVRTLAELEVKPEFPGGIEKFYKFVGNNFRQFDNKLSGKVVARFVIEIDGSLSNYTIIKNEIDTASGEELIRVLKKCPKWIPGSKNGKFQRVFYSVPITLQSGI